MLSRNKVIRALKAHLGDDKPQPINQEDTEIAALIAQCGLFDRDYYLKTNLDVAEAGVDPLSHYLSYGRFEGRAPSSHFDPRAYLDHNPDLSQAGIDPVIHYIRYGRAEGRASQSTYQLFLNSGLFDHDYYRAAYLDVALSGQDLLEHYVRHGRWEGRRPSLDFDPHVYLSRNPDLQQAGVDPLTHYIQSGRTEGRYCRPPGLGRRDLPDALAQLRSSGLFDAGFYVSQCPALQETDIDPLLHYVVGGYSHFVDPSPTFSTDAYLLEHLDVRTSHSNPLLHFLHSGIDKYSDEVRSDLNRPDDAVSLERLAGAAYFQRFLFPLGPVHSPAKYVTYAVAALAGRSPRLSLERAEPDVSIIIPIYGQLHFVLSCLESLSRQASRFSVEIIIGDDASPEAAETRRLEAIPWISFRSRQSNGGFLDNCNYIAGTARGRFLVFLNSHTRVAAGWLDELVGSFDLFPKSGLSGSNLFNDDGSLQAAGGICWRDGSVWSYGMGEDPNHPKYCFARQVDYVSSASIAIPAEIWHRMGGFDRSYRPDPSTDADLAFRIRAAGYQVWLQPLSRVIRYKGKTDKQELIEDGKEYQKANMRRLAERWKGPLTAHGPNGQLSDHEANREVGACILVLDGVTPRPDQDSGSFITFRMLRALQTLGYHVIFIPQHTYAYDKTYTASLQRWGIECLYLPYFQSITDVLGSRTDFGFVLAYRFHVLDRVYDEIRRRIPAARIIFHSVDLHFLREEREASLFSSESKKIAAAITRATELELIEKVDCTIVHTKVEGEVIKKYLPIDNIVEFPYIAELHRTQVAFEDRHDVMFLGGFNHPPNVDSVMHFVASVWPVLQKRLPAHARFVIVGPSAPEEIKALSGPRIVVTGYVENLEDYFDVTRVFVAPIRYGAGIKGKVIQSLCYGTPSVITSIAAEGIGLVSGRDTIIADADFADQVLRLYFDRSLWYLLQAAGYEFVENNFSWSRCLDLCTKVLNTAEATWLARRATRL